MLRKFFAVSALLLVSACVSPVKVIEPLAEEKKNKTTVHDVRVSYSELAEESLIKLDEEVKAAAAEEEGVQEQKFKPLKEAMREIVLEKLGGRDLDDMENVDIEIELDNLKFSNPALVILVGDSDQLSGSVRILDATDQTLLSEFYVDVLQPQSGLIGLAIRGTGVRERLAERFASFVGDQLGYEREKIDHSKVPE